MSETEDDGTTLSAAEQNDETADLVRAAAAGDRRAAGEYFAQNLHRLSLTARKIAGTSVDHGDLLGDALVIVLSKWADGTGPTGNVHAYISKIMRNRLLDDLKSPRSQVRPLDPAHDPPAAEDSRVRRVEMEQELALVRRALTALPADQREVLVATIIEGQKPRDLEDRLGRPASSIYSLTKRAKDNLRRTILQILLGEEARPGCSRAAKHLPKAVGDSPEESDAGSWAEHYRTCRRCRRIWARFGTLTTLGIAPLLVVSDLLSVPPASASTGDDTTSESPTTPPQQPNPEGVSGWGVARARALDLIGPVTAVIGIAIVGILGVAFLTKTLWFASDPTADIGVRTAATTPTTTELELRFEVINETWHTRSLEVALSETVHQVQPPPGWRCAPSGPVITCVTTEANARGGIFRLEHARTDAPPSYRITLTTTTESGDTVVGTGSGDVQP